MGVVHGRVRVVRVVSGTWEGESGEWYMGGMRVVSGNWRGESGEWYVGGMRVVSGTWEG